MAEKLPVLIQVPEKVNGDLAGYEFLANLAGLTIDFVRENIIFDFNNCVGFEGNLSSVFGNILQGLLDRGNQVQFSKMRGQIIGVLSRNGFLKSFESDYSLPHLDDTSTSVPYKRFQLQDESSVKEFVRTSLFEKTGMPKMSDSAQKGILVSIFEVCVNAITHGGCQYVYCCGQVFPNANEPKVAISFVDLGRTIPANVNEFLATSKNGYEAIIWALQEGNTTKTGNEPGGIGLKLLQNLVNANKGSLQIVSGDGFVNMRNNNFQKHSLNKPFPGTIVTLELKLGDPNFYVLSSEVTNADDIF